MHSMPSISPIAHVKAGASLSRAAPGSGALDGQQRVPIGDVARVRAADLAVPDPLEGGLPVRGVDDEQVAALLEPVDDQVVDDAAGLGREERTERRPRPPCPDRWRAATAGAHEPSGPRPRPRPCARRRRRRSPGGRRGARATPSYCTGISQPANGTMRAPSATWRSKSGVRSSVCMRG